MPQGALTPEAAAEVLRWAAPVRRDLPWRRTRSPWPVLVAEVMLQQTPVRRVVPRWEPFLTAFPDPATCASAPLGEVLRSWEGLGYPRRARNLQRAAEAITRRFGGVVPGDLDSLLTLPGVGPYTARAVLAFAFERDVGVVDTNTGRILARVGGALLGAAEAQRTADRWVPEGRGWEWNQALLDLGAGVCRPRPECASCPLRRWCRWAAEGRAHPDPAVASAGVSVPQAPFEGSDRQIRGRLLRAAGSAVRAHPEMVTASGVPGDVPRVDRLIGDLEGEGLLVRRGGGWALP